MTTLWWRTCATELTHTLPVLCTLAGFCGDGANDVGALKAAHVGVSLCEAEASVAAPLTSKKQSIACMLTVVAEGRCSLSTSYLIFKYIIVYAFIQVGGMGRKEGQGVR
jgi:cation-transporting ATPase 13A2